MLYKYVKPERIDILENLNIVFTPFDELNDPFECQFVLNPIPEEELEAQNDENLAEWAQVQVWLEHRIGQLGMLCLTHTDQSLPMWAHYADNHQGFVLGFEEDNSFFKSDAYYIEPTLRTKQEASDTRFWHTSRS